MPFEVFDYYLIFLAFAVYRGNDGLLVDDLGRAELDGERRSHSAARRLVGLSANDLYLALFACLDREYLTVDGYLACHRRYDRAVEFVNVAFVDSRIVVVEFEGLRRRTGDRVTDIEHARIVLIRIIERRRNAAAAVAVGIVPLEPFIGSGRRNALTAARNVDSRVGNVDRVVGRRAPIGAFVGHACGRSH